ncbi:MAG: molybdopterin-containing oxidoreductase catalytic subunit [Planctomycetes bacterium]|nr:molybdopterin-containing oxidoreductase catalytic subunit [Planctomycetota bacterium]
MPPQILHTTCNRDCPDACGITATVEDGKVTQLVGRKDHPVTNGFLCFRTSRFPELAASPARVSQPLVRKDGVLQPASWDEALALVAGRLLQIRQESGPAAIFHYRSGGSLGILKHLTDLFFDQFGPCTGKVGDICSGAGEAAQLHDLGTSDSNDLFDLLHSKHIVLWGKNPAVSNVHLVPVLKDAQARGAQVVLVDPIHHKSAPLAAVRLAPAPGRDLELALGIARCLFDGGHVVADAATFTDGLAAFRRLADARSVAEWAQLADVAEADLRALAARFADGPTAILVGWGMQRRQRGGAIVRALDALCALSGNLFRSGGGVSFYFRRRKAFQPFGPKVTPPRVVREPLLGHDLLAAQGPPIRCLWVTAGNPVAMLPDAATVARAIEQTEFVVVADCLLTDTAKRAHVVLPVPTLLEDSDVLGAYGHHWIAESRPVVPMPPGVRHEVAIFQELAQRVGLASYPQDSLDHLKRHALGNVAGQGAGLESLRKHGVVRSPVAEPLLFPSGRVLTATGRVQLLGEAAPPPDLPVPPAQVGASAPLWLFSNSTEKSQASQWAGKGLGERLWVAVHPDAVPGIADGGKVRIESVAGSLAAEVRHDPAQRRDVAIVPKGGHFDRGQSANAIIPAVATDLGLGAAYLDCLVRIVPE